MSFNHTMASTVTNQLANRSFAKKHTNINEYVVSFFFCKFILVNLHFSFVFILFFMRGWFIDMSVIPFVIKYFYLWIDHLSIICIRIILCDICGMTFLGATLVYVYMYIVNKKSSVHSHLNTHI